MQITVESQLQKSVKTFDVPKDSVYVFSDGEVFECVGGKWVSLGACATAQETPRVARPTFAEQHKFHGLPSFPEKTEPVVVDSPISE